MRPDPLIFLSSGEASGDHYGAELIARLQQVLPMARFTGLGGQGMQTAGQRRIVRAEDVAFMGITEILRHVPRVLNSYRKLVAALHRERPQIAVLIDFPDVNFRLAKHCKRLGIPVIWFVSPQLWAWKRKRLRWVQERVSQMLTIFPFEETFYRNRGVDATFVGHPLAEAGLPAISREDFATAHGLGLDRGWIALLPGSRSREIAANLPAMLQAARQIAANPDVPASLLPHFDTSKRVTMVRVWVGNERERLAESWWQFLLPVASTADYGDLQKRIDTQGPLPPIHLVHDARAALFHARAAVIASGTATVQAAVLGTPFVTVYRVSDTTFRAAKRLVRYSDEITAVTDQHGNLPVAMPNLIAGRRVTPELLQEQFTAENVVAALRPLLHDGPERDEMLAGLHEIRSRLLSQNGVESMDRLRDAVLHELRRTG